MTENTNVKRLRARLKELNHLVITLDPPASELASEQAEAVRQILEELDASPTFAQPDGGHVLDDPEQRADSSAAVETEVRLTVAELEAARQLEVLRRQIINLDSYAIASNELDDVCADLWKELDKDRKTPRVARAEPRRWVGIFSSAWKNLRNGSPSSRIGTRRAGR